MIIKKQMTCISSWWDYIWQYSFIRRILWKRVPVGPLSLVPGPTVYTNPVMYGGMAFFTPPRQFMHHKNLIICSHNDLSWLLHNLINYKITGILYTVEIIYMWCTQWSVTATDPGKKYSTHVASSNLMLYSLNNRGSLFIVSKKAFMLFQRY